MLRSNCLQTTSPPTCSHCKAALPLMYVSRHGNPNGDLAILSIVGFGGCGVKAYLAAPLHTNEHELVFLGISGKIR